MCCQQSWYTYTLPLHRLYHQSWLTCSLVPQSFCPCSTCAALTNLRELTQCVSYQKEAVVVGVGSIMRTAQEDGERGRLHTPASCLLAPRHRLLYTDSTRFEHAAPRTSARHAGYKPAAASPPRWHGRNVRPKWPVAENAKQHIKMNLISGNSASLSCCRFAPDALKPQTSQSLSRSASSSNSWNFWSPKPFGLQWCETEETYKYQLIGGCW